MTIEARRRCGYRKVGGLYMMGGQLERPCCRFPIELSVCPCCGMGIRLTRVWTWIDPRPWLAAPCAPGWPTGCVAANAENFKAEDDDAPRVGLLNVGAAFYPRPADFLEEANAMGISRRITTVPRGFKLGQHWVFLAHPRLRVLEGEDDAERYVGGIFGMFRPTSIDKLVTQTEAANEEAMQRLRDRDITPVVVPDDDPHHRGTVYDDLRNDENQLELPVGVEAVNMEDPAAMHDAIHRAVGD